jgi:AraC-like DNA-binding protein
MPLQPRVTEVEQLLFCSDVAAAGSFRCPAHHPLFVDSGPASGYLLVFPRTSTTIVHQHGRAITAGPPMALFYNDGDVYTRRKIDEIDDSDWFMIAPDVVREVVSRYDRRAADRDARIIPFSLGPATAAAYLFQRRLHTALQGALQPAEPLDTLAVEETMVAIFHDVVREASRLHALRGEPHNTRLEGAVERVKALLALRPAANPALRTLASQAGCSPFQLCRAFRTATGQTITEYRHALRLRLALSRLRTDRDDLTQIALDLGYSSHSHFTLAFRRRFGITPSAFRRMQGRGGG